MSSQATASMSKPYCRVILILLTVACGVCAVVTAPIALLTAAMAFDAPDSDYQTVGVDRVLRDPVDPAVVRHRCCCWMGSLPPRLAANVSGARGNTARRRDARLAAAPVRLIGDGLPRPTPYALPILYWASARPRSAALRKYFMPAALS